MLLLLWGDVMDLSYVAAMLQYCNGVTLVCCKVLLVGLVRLKL